jgi:pheromone shutdown protein TraB
MAGPQIDLVQLAGTGHKYDLAISTESSEDADARRKKDTADADAKRRMTFHLFWFALVMIAIVFAGCVYMLANGSADDKKWAAGIVSAIASGLVGFLVGQSKK